jgi:hypothetical protein
MTKTLEERLDAVLSLIERKAESFSFDRILTVQDFARAAGVPIGTVNKAIANGTIKPIRTSDNRFYFSADDLIKVRGGE